MKLTTKLLLGATVVAGLSVSAFATCATDVDMGAKKLTNVANGTADGDAVNVAQVFNADIEFIDMSDVNNTDASSSRLRWVMVGNKVCLTGIVREHSAILKHVPIPTRMQSSINPFIPINHVNSSGDYVATNMYIDQAKAHNLNAPAAAWTMFNACYTKE